MCQCLEVRERHQESIHGYKDQNNTDRERDVHDVEAESVEGGEALPVLDQHKEGHHQKAKPAKDERKDGQDTVVVIVLNLGHLGNNGAPEETSAHLCELSVRVRHDRDQQVQHQYHIAEEYSYMHTNSKVLLPAFEHVVLIDVEVAKGCHHVSPHCFEQVCEGFELVEGQSGDRCKRQQPQDVDEQKAEDNGEHAPDHNEHRPERIRQPQQNNASEPESGCNKRHEVVQVEDVICDVVDDVACEFDLGQFVLFGPEERLIQVTALILFYHDPERKYQHCQGQVNDVRECQSESPLGQPCKDNFAEDADWKEEYERREVQDEVKFFSSITKLNHHVTMQFSFQFLELLERHQ